MEHNLGCGRTNRPRLVAVTKLILALHGDDLARELHDPGLRVRLRAAGARRLQLNLDDADVAQAPLRFGPGTPITAVVSVWADGPVEAVVEPVVEGVPEGDPTADGWQVEEGGPVPPPRRPPGARGGAP